MASRIKKRFLLIENWSDPLRNDGYQLIRSRLRPGRPYRSRRKSIAKARAEKTKNVPRLRLR
jgi:hypothetical protein